MRREFIALFFALSLSACARSGNTPIPEQTVEELASPTAELAPPPTAIIAPTLAPQPTATADLRLPPERWQEWPVVPEATGRAIEIYAQGLVLGNDPRAFSKVGDCQNIREAFMGFFDQPDRYNLGADYQYLQETIDQFSGYFNTDGQAVKGGFNAATVLSPLWANPEFCLAGENPLECELRVTRPSIVFVSFEVWWDGRTVQQYDSYMRQIIDTIIAHGAVPILASKADNVEGDHSINLATARLAHEYDLPLWNFWLAVQNLPNHGLDSTRNDGFHISTDGWNVRSFTGLQALDSVWRGLRNAGQAVAVAPTQAPTPVGSDVLTPALPNEFNALAAGDSLIFGMASRQGGHYQSEGIYLLNLGTDQLVPVLSPGWDFRGASTDGRSLLVNRGPRLFHLIDGAPVLISDSFFSNSMKSTLVLPDGQFLFIQDGNAGLEIARASRSGSAAEVVLQPDAAPLELLSIADSSRLTWASGSCSGYGICTPQAFWLTDLQTGQTQELAMTQPVLAPDGGLLAYRTLTGENDTELAFAGLNGGGDRLFELPGDLLEAFAWSPDGNWIAVHQAVRSDYSGRVTDGLNFLVELPGYLTRQLPSAVLLDPVLVWSPDASGLAWMGTDWQDGQYTIRLSVSESPAFQTTPVTALSAIQDPDYIFVTGGAWINK
jgi:hypothetical protein